MMSPSELLRETGLRLSTRQFRRYMAAGIIPGVKCGKRGRYVILGPVTPARIARTKERIRKFRGRSGRKRLRYIPPAAQTKFRRRQDFRFRRLNLSGILIEFGRWMDQSDPVDMWSDEKKKDVLRELLPAVIVAIRLANDLNVALPEWDGTKAQLQRFRY
jgi:hypothetical protein